MSNDTIVIRDWTKETIVIDMVNSIGEKFHFEVPPNTAANIISRPTLDGKKRDIKLYFPLPYQMDMFENPAPERGTGER